jgi:hypothetical protein
VEKKEASRVVMWAGPASAAGFTVAALWGRYTFNGDLPWGTMLAVFTAVGIPLAVVIGVFSRSGTAWDGWPGVALMFVCCLVATLSAILLGT